MLPRVQGDLALLAAAHQLAKHGYTICIPLTDNQPYDLVIEKNKQLQRVQVKSTSRHDKGDPSRPFVVELRRKRHNSKTTKTHLYDIDAADLLVVVTSHEEYYLIPNGRITATSQLHLNKKFEKYRLGRTSQ